MFIYVSSFVVQHGVFMYLNNEQLILQFLFMDMYDSRLYVIRRD